jgi:hypothetical protein
LAIVGVVWDPTQVILASPQLDRCVEYKLCESHPFEFEFSTTV